ncbi:MAG TPA: 5-oxoprolinase subunit PxpB [Xanthobacteraceae bacterium]|nr:5-oxoprolinase subunit PxpB [Xanthobacteraceae bacterium]
MLDYRLLPAGDTALVVEFGDRIDRSLSAAVLALAQALDEERIAGVIETVPTFRSLMVHYEPLAVSFDTLAARIGERVGTLRARETAGRSWHLPVCYDRRFAIDLDEVARRTSLTAQQIVERHSAEVYHVYMLGFLPGQAYMGEVAAELALERLPSPRTAIPAGSLAIAGRMSCVFPLETPCGWHIIGRCPIPLWDPARGAALLAPADKVTFIPVSAREYETLRTRAAEGVLRVEPVSEIAGAVA